MARKNLEDYKKESPEIPSITCPYIDFIQEILKEVRENNNSVFDEQKLNLADSMLEYIRESNDALRKNSSYWFHKFRTLMNKK